MEGKKGAQRKDIKRGKEGRYRGKREEKDIRVVAYVSTCVCLWMRAAVFMHVSLHAFMHERVCFCVQHGGCSGYSESYL